MDEGHHAALIIDPFDDLWRGFRNITRKETMLVTRILYTQGPMSFGDLQKTTKLPRNTLNHTLTDMKNLYLLMKKGDKKYCLTNYCVLLCNSFDTISASLSSSAIDMMLRPYNSEEI